MYAKHYENNYGQQRKYNAKEMDINVY